MTQWTSCWGKVKMRCRAPLRDCTAMQELHIDASAAVGSGAQPDAHKNDNGFTALIVAAVQGHDKVVERLLASGAELDQQTKVRLL